MWQKFAKNLHILAASLAKYFVVSANHVASRGGVICYVTDDVTHAKARPVSLQLAASCCMFVQVFATSYFTSVLRSALRSVHITHLI